ncbi:MAG: NUDIX hydrolase [Elusimicrobiota bacterium]|jgi:ADP-ribose pyrophosphatase|nr:NUDIX hydrolase [Elusimicrobiota bacterium]
MPNNYYSKLKESKIKSKKLYRGAVGFNVDTVRLPNGKKSVRAYIVHPGASAILPIIADSVVMVEQYRYPVKDVLLEIPAGKIKSGQTPLACAKAELREETGYKARKFQKLISFNPTCAFADEILHIYLAEKLSPGKTNLDEDEFVNTKIIPLKKAYEMIESGKIKDSKTIIALLYYRTFLNYPIGK